jgi:hypothetical protein
LQAPGRKYGSGRRSAGGTAGSATSGCIVNGADRLPTETSHPGAGLLFGTIGRAVPSRWAGGTIDGPVRLRVFSWRWKEPIESLW